MYIKKGFFLLSIVALITIYFIFFDKEDEIDVSKRMYKDNEKLFFQVNDLIMSLDGVSEISQSCIDLNCDGYKILNEIKRNKYKEIVSSMKNIGVNLVYVSREIHNKDKVRVVDYYTYTHGLSISGYAVSISYIIDATIMEKLKPLGYKYYLIKNDWFVVFNPR